MRIQENLVGANKRPTQKHHLGSSYHGKDKKANIHTERDSWEDQARVTQSHKGITNQQKTTGVRDGRKDVQPAKRKERPRKKKEKKKKGNRMLKGFRLRGETGRKKGPRHGVLKDEKKRGKLETRVYQKWIHKKVAPD